MQNSIMNTREENSDPIPVDLVVEISSRLPAKSIARFRCVSKLWGSTFHLPYFTELFLTRSWARPRLLLVLERDDGCSVYSSLQPHNQYDKSSPLLIANSAFHMKFPEHMCPRFRCHASGLIYFSEMQISHKTQDRVPFICNPRTGQYASLPKPNERNATFSFLGFDPIDKQFKVLSISNLYGDNERDGHRILTLGTGEMRWRKIQCPFIHNHLCEGISINGVLYYLGFDRGSSVIVCFDFRSEKFRLKPIGTKCFYPQFFQLINYKGKLGGMTWNNGGLRLWVLEDVEKQEWSTYVYTLPDNELIVLKGVSFTGVTATGEIVLSERHTSERFHVFYFNPERNTLQRVEIQGLEKDSMVYVYVDHVEDLDINDAKYLKYSSPRLNIIRARPKPQRRDRCSSAPSVKNKQSTNLLQNKYELLAKLE